MTIAPGPRHDFTFADYLAIERDSDVRHEFFDGQIFAMGGGTRRHAALTFEIGYQIRRQLDDKPCEVLTADMRVRSKETGLATYADVTVLCGPPEMDPDDAEETTLLNPSLIVEVTSKWSERNDRSKKLAHYRTIPSLHTIVVVSQRERLVEIHERDAGVDGNPAATWRPLRTVIKASFELVWLGVVLDVDRVYAGASRAR